MINPINPNNPGKNANPTPDLPPVPAENGVVKPKNPAFDNVVHNVAANAHVNHPAVRNIVQPPVPKTQPQVKPPAADNNNNGANLNKIV